LVAESPAAIGQDEGRETRSQRRRRWALFGGIAAVVVLLDQLTKAWVDAGFEPASAAGPTQLIGDLVRISKVYNDGAIFGVLDTSASLMAVLTVFVAAGVIWYEWRHGAGLGPLVTVGLGLLIGGAIGNLIDRLRFGHVIDFVDMGIGDTRWYAWNISDAAVFLGIVALLAAGLLGDRAPGVRPGASK
jgi:signal peptidase II